MWGNSKRDRNVFDFRQELRRQKHRARMTTLKVVLVGLSIGMIAGAGIIAWPTASASFSASSAEPHFSLCRGPIRKTCVVDGDTFWLSGKKIRIADIDTPEMKGRCEWESAKAREARDRLLVLLNDGPFELAQFGARDEDKYGRKLRVVLRSGRSLGDQLVSEGLARTWSGRREPWC